MDKRKYIAKYIDTRKYIKKDKVFIGFVIMFVIGALLAMSFTLTFYNPTPALLASENYMDSQKDSPIVDDIEGKFEVVERTIAVLAVNSRTNTGSVGNLTVKIIPGSGNVLIDTNPYTQTDLQYSTNVAAMIAEDVAVNNATHNDIIYSYKTQDPVVIIGGGSAGAAETIATIAALDGRTIKSDVAITGSINPDGTIGLVEGIAEKAKAAAQAGYKLLLVPKGQSVIHYYTPTVYAENMGGIIVYRERYNITSVDIAQQAKAWGLEIKEVENIQDVMKYMLV